MSYCLAVQKSAHVILILTFLATASRPAETATKLSTMISTLAVMILAQGGRNIIWLWLLPSTNTVINWAKFFVALIFARIRISINNVNIVIIEKLKTHETPY